MKRLIEFTLEDGTCIIVEVDEPDSEGGFIDAARTGSVITKAHQTFEHAIEAVKPAADVIIKKLQGLNDPPDEIEVEFGLKLTAEAGAVLAASGIEANYSVTLVWKREDKKPGNPQRFNK